MRMHMASLLLPFFVTRLKISNHLAIEFTAIFVFRKFGRPVTCGEKFAKRSDVVCTWVVWHGMVCVVCCVWGQRAHTHTHNTNNLKEKNRKKNRFGVGCVSELLRCGCGYVEKGVNCVGVYVRRWHFRVNTTVRWILAMECDSVFRFLYFLWQIRVCSVIPTHYRHFEFIYLCGALEKAWAPCRWEDRFMTVDRCTSVGVFVENTSTRTPTYTHEYPAHTCTTTIGYFICEFQYKQIWVLQSPFQPI